jgi:hypothetical protein
VVLDHAFVKPAVAQIERFERAGVGLASVAQGQGLFIHYTAGTHGPMSPAKRWQAQAVLSARVLARRSVSVPA